MSTLLGGNVMESETDDLKSISAKLEVINLQLAQRKTTRRRVLHWILIVIFHSFEWLFVRAEPMILIGAIIGIFLTRKKE